MVGISGIEQGSVVAERYRVVERINRFAVAERSLTGVEYEYWLAFDEARAVEVWLQIGALGDVAASGAQFAGAVAALRRLNHPAIPAILDFGEIEVEVAVEAGVDAAGGPADTVVADVGYAVLEPVEGESLAALLMRGALTEAEVFLALTEIAEAFKLLHEMELVHGHLSAYSVLLTERGVVLIDVVASLALENASGAVLTPAADIYAFAWLICVALAGVETVEAEFGVGFDTGSSPEDEYASGVLTAELVERRRAWAQRNLVAVFGIEAGLAALLIAALGESGGRPTAAALVSALRVRGVVEEEAVAVMAEAAVAEEVVAVEEVAAAVVAEEEIAGSAGAVIYGGIESAGAVQAETVGAVGGGAAVATMAVGAELGAGAYPETVPPSGPTRHRRPKSALYAAVAIVIIIAVAVIWGLSARKPATSASPANSAGPSSAAASPSDSAGTSSAPEGVASPSASAAASSAAASPSASAVANTGPSASTSPGVLATAPTSPSQALQQVQQAVSQAQAAGQIPSQAQGSLNQAIGTLQQEISSGGSVQQGVTQLRQALSSPGLSQTLVSQINSLIQYLAGTSGS